MKSRIWERKKAIQRATEDGEIPTDRMIYAFYVDFYCEDCERCTRGISQRVLWSHIGGNLELPDKMECWECGGESISLKTWLSPWDAPLDRLPESAIPDGYFDG